MKKKFAPKNQFLTDFENIDIAIFSKKLIFRKLMKNWIFGAIFFSKYLIFRGDAENDVYFFDRSYFLVTLKPQKLDFFDFQRALGMPLTGGAEFENPKTLPFQKILFLSKIYFLTKFIGEIF